MSVSQIFYSRLLSNEHLFTYDPYDIWNTNIGQWVKKLYYRNSTAGLLPSALLVLFDSYINNRSRIGYSKREYPVVYAYKVLLAIELYKRHPHSHLLEEARCSLTWLALNYSKGYSGHCWGANMPWVSKNATYKEETPFITNTPYVLEALTQFSQISNDTTFDYMVPTILAFIETDLIKMVDSSNELALSYSPYPEKRIVINANSYAMFCYSVFNQLYPGQSTCISDKVIRLYNFIKNHQRPDGSWFYYADDLPGNFIDCFHSCFILKNLYKANKTVCLENFSETIQLGYKYLKVNFFDHQRKLFKRFAKTDKASIIQFDLYDNAEMLNLSILLKDGELTDILSQSIKEEFVRGNDIYSQIILSNKRIQKNTLRWAVMPMLYAFASCGR